MKRPLAILALPYVGGILLGDCVRLPLWLLFALSGAILVGAAVWGRARLYLLVVLLVAAGWTNLARQTEVLSPRDLRVLVGEEPDLATIQGRLCQSPVQRIYERNQQQTVRSIAYVDAQAICRAENWEPASGRVAVTTPGELAPIFFEGQSVEVTGVIQPPGGPVAPGLFDYRKFLRRKGVYYQLKTETTNDWRLAASEADGARRPLPERFCNWARNTMARGLPVEDEALRLRWAMALGWKTALTDDVSEPFMRTGTMHIFAISGLHIALIALIMVSLLRTFQIPRRICGLFVIPILWFYTVATGLQPSAIRATIMMTVVVGGWALQRPGDLLNSLAAAAFIILLWQPQQLFQASFQLSFFVVLSIALIVPRIEALRQRLLKSDPFLPPELRPGWRRWLDRPIKYLAGIMATSMAAWIGSLPLIANYFHLLTPISLLANLLVVPLGGLALMCNMGSLICGAWLGPVTVLFNHSGWFWMLLMINLCEWMAALPGAYFYVRSPSLVEFALYYLVVFGIATGWMFAAKRRFWIGLAIALLGCVWLWRGFTTRNNISLTALAVSGGDSVYFDAPGRANDLLIDCGNSAVADYTVTPFLRSRGVNRLSQLLLTHGDVQHIGAATNIIHEFKARNVITSPVNYRSAAYRRVIELLERSPQRWRIVSGQDEIGPWRVLYPTTGEAFPRADDNAIVLKGDLNGVRVLLLSDLGRLGQRALLKRGVDLRADIVIAGMPSLDEPLSDYVLDAIHPRVIILSTSHFPASSHAGRPLRERLRRSGIPTIYTSDDGTVTLLFRQGRCELQTMSGRAICVEPGR